MPPSPNPNPSTEPASAFSGPNKVSSRARGGRHGRGGTSPMTPAPNGSPQPESGFKSLSRRRPPYPSENFSTQANKHSLENKSRHNHLKPPSLSKTNDVVPKSPYPSSDVQSNIDALVERVRASAMANNRPNTPGSHIDWAGDDDNSLPDLDDWGISPPALPTAHTMISPIIVDGLTPLPEPAATLENQDESLVNATTTASIPHSPVGHIPNGDTGKKLDQPNLSDPVDDPKIAPSTVPILHPSLPHKPATSARKTKKQGDDKHPNAKMGYSRTRDAKANDEAKTVTTHWSKLQPSQVDVLKQLKHKDSNEIEKGLAASIHAPERQVASKISEPKSEKPSTLEHHYPVKGIASAKNPQASGQQPSPHLPTNRPYHSSRRSLTNNQTQTQAPVANPPSRSSHSRPVLTGDALSKLARTIGGASAPATKSIPLSTSTE